MYKLFDIGIHSIMFERIISKKKYFEQKSADDKKHEQLPRKPVWVLILVTIYKVIFAQYCALNLEVLCAFCLSEPSADTLENSLNPDSGPTNYRA